MQELFSFMKKILFGVFLKMMTLYQSNEKIMEFMKYHVNVDQASLVRLEDI